MVGRIMIAAAVLALAAPQARANLITNGSFEDNYWSNGGTNAGLGYLALATGDTTSITGWTVGGVNGVDLIDTYWKASDGTYSIDLNAFDQGSISQNFNTIIGHGYTVTFDLAANPGISVASLKVIAGATSANYSFTAQSTPLAGYTDGDIGFTPETFFFVATSTTTLLTFNSLVGGSAGNALDNINVTDVPEPASLAAMAAGLLGLTMLRRRKA